MVLVKKGDDIINELGFKAKKKLIDLEKTQEWLCNEIENRTGLKCDGSYLSKIYHDKRHPTIVINAIKDILELEDAS